MTLLDSISAQKGEYHVSLTRRWGDGVGWRASWVAHVVALAVLVALAAPSRAAEERAVKSKVAPMYPEIAKRLHVSGMVKLVVTVDADGKVTDVKTVSGNQLLAAAAEEAVHKWRYVAGDRQTTVDLSINFDLPK